MPQDDDEKRSMNASPRYRVKPFPFHQLSFCVLTQFSVLSLHISCLLPYAVNCGRFCFWRRQSVFFVCVRNISGTAERICARFTRKTCLVPRWDEFEGQGQRSSTPGTKTAFSALSAVCVRFMFGKTSSASNV